MKPYKIYGYVAKHKTLPTLDTIKTDILEPDTAVEEIEKESIDIIVDTVEETKPEEETITAQPLIEEPKTRKKNYNSTKTDKENVENKPKTQRKKKESPSKKDGDK